MAASVRPLLIAIDGLSGAGKTTLAVELAVLLREHLRVSIFHLEDIYPGWDGLRRGLDRYVRDVVLPLRSGKSATWRAWDWEADDDGPGRRTDAADVVVLEGVGAGCSAARPYLDAVIWVEAPAELRRTMALTRDGEAYEPFWDRWADQEKSWLAADDVPSLADVVVQGHQGTATPALVLDSLTDLPSLAGGLSHLPRPALSLHAEKVPASPGHTRESPVALFSSLFVDSVNAAWLDSSNAAELSDRNRFSIMADDGGRLGRMARHDEGTTTVARGPVSARIREPFFRWLNAVWGTVQVETPPDYPCAFALGWLGYLGYELKRETGGTGGPTAGLTIGRTPDACLMLAGRAVVIDHQTEDIWLLTLSDEAEDPGTKDWLAAARAAIRGPVAADDDGAPPPCGAFTIRDSRDDYLAMIAAAQEEIRQGNSYEVCLTTELTARAGHLDPLHVYGALRRGSPAPFANYLRFGGVHIAGSSPERFLAVTAEGALRAEPIKGTRRRVEDPAADAALRDELKSSLKDRAENIMIVDLLRNDLSHFAVPGTVSVSRLCAVESYATVHQMVSTIDARLRPGASRAEAIAAAFPAGSMTGAPKISTMEILDRLETGPRGVYSGAVGFLSLTGAVELSVVIRTLVMRGDDAGFDLSLGVGGAITADSVPADEWDEVRTKARGVLDALGSKFPSGG